MHRPLFTLPKKIIVATLIGALLFTSALAPLTIQAQVFQPDELGEGTLPDGSPDPISSGNVTSGNDGSLFPSGGIGNNNAPGLGSGSGNGSIPGGSGIPSGGTPAFNANSLGDTQARNFVNGQTGTQSQTGAQTTTDLASEGVSCAAGQVLGQLLTAAISSAISSLISSVVGNVAQTAATTLLTVPINTTFDSAGQHTVGDVRARSGGFTMFGIFINVSWDGIAWCVVNAMIEYIANSTIAWANSGFNGNPAFLQNPDRFFSNLADYAAGSIIKDIAYGATNGKLNVCQPFRIQIAVGLSQSYGNDANSRYRGMSCRLSDITSKKFFGGISVGTTQSKKRSQGTAVNWSEWMAVTQNDENNPYGSYILANEALYSSISAQQNTLKFEVGLNNGWLNFKKCKNGEKDLTKCDTVTPGRLIESQLNQTLGLSKQRLVIANKFDQMITAIVNNLIKVALNKVLN